MANKLKMTEKLIILFLLILILFLFGCKSKKVNHTHTDSLVKEFVMYKDSVNTKTIFEYETIFDTINKVYVTTIKKVIMQESQNKSLQSHKDTKINKDTKSVIKEPSKAKNQFWNYLFIIGLAGTFFLGLYIRK